MSDNSPLNLPLDFGVPDETRLAKALADKDFETAGKLYAQGMLMTEPGFELQDFLEALEGGAELSDEAIGGYARRIYASLAMVDMDKDPLSQNMLYQATLNAMSEPPGSVTSEGRLIAALMQYPFAKTGKHSVVGTFMEAAWDDLVDTGIDRASNEAFVIRAGEVFGQGRFEKHFAVHGLIRHFESDNPTQETTIGLFCLLLNQSSVFSAVQQALVEKHGVESNGRCSLSVLIHALKNTIKPEWRGLIDTVYTLEKLGYDVKAMTNSVETKEEYSLLSADLEMEASYFDPQSIKSHMVDHVFATDLGL